MSSNCEHPNDGCDGGDGGNCGCPPSCQEHHPCPKCKGQQPVLEEKEKTVDVRPALGIQSVYPNDVIAGLATQLFGLQEQLKQERTANAKANAEHAEEIAKLNAKNAKVVETLNAKNAKVVETLNAKNAKVVETLKTKNAEEAEVALNAIITDILDAYPLPDFKEGEDIPNPDLYGEDLGGLKIAMENYRSRKTQRDKFNELTTKIRQRLETFGSK